MSSRNPLRSIERSGLASLFVSRPVLGIVVNLLILVAGLAALSSVDVREMPDVEQPVISVTTEYEGAVPETCLLYTSPSPRDRQKSRMPSSA